MSAGTNEIRCTVAELGEPRDFVGIIRTQPFTVRYIHQGIAFDDVFALTFSNKGARAAPRPAAKPAAKITCEDDRIRNSADDPAFSGTATGVTDFSLSRYDGFSEEDAPDSVAATIGCASAEPNAKEVGAGLGLTKECFVLQIFASGVCRVVQTTGLGAGTGWACWKLSFRFAAGSGTEETNRQARRTKIEALKRTKSVNALKWTHFEGLTSEKPMIKALLGANKDTVHRGKFKHADARSRCKPESNEVWIATFKPISGSGDDAQRQFDAQHDEVLFATDGMSEHVSRALGCIFHAQPEDGIEAIVYDVTTVQYVLETVLIRKDIDVLSTLPFFVRQLLAAVVSAEGARGTGAVLRNLDPERIVIYNRPADGTMSARLMDCSSVFSVEDTATARRSTPWNSYDQNAPEGRLAGFGSSTVGRVTAATDVFCVGLLVTHALLASMHYGGSLRWQYDALRRQGPEALRRAVESVELRSDNGLRAFALAALHPDPAHRPTASVALSMLYPGTPFLPICTGQLASSALEQPLNTLPPWWHVTMAGQDSLKLRSREEKDAAAKAADADVEARTKLPATVLFGLRKRTKPAAAGSAK